MTTHYLEEEEFTSEYNNETIKRILAQTLPHWKWLVGFIFSIGFVSFLDAYFTYLSKRIIDDAIIPGDVSELISIVTTYGILIIAQSFGVFAFIYLTGVLGQRVNHLKTDELPGIIQDDFGVDFWAPAGQNGFRCLPRKMPRKSFSWRRSKKVL